MHSHSYASIEGFWQGLKFEADIWMRVCSNLRSRQGRDDDATIAGKPKAVWGNGGRGRD